jgi:hypothetical protein
LGIARLDALRDRELDGATVFDTVAKSYGEWLELFVAPPARPEGTLRPLVLPLTGLNPTDEAATASQTLLVCHSVGIEVPNTLSYLRRLLRLLILLEDEIDAGLVVLIPDKGTLEPAGMYADWRSKQRGRFVGRERTDDGMLHAATEFFAEAEVVVALDLCSQFPDELDLACRTAEQSRYLRSLLEEARLRGSMDLSHAHDRLSFLPELLSLQLPCFDLSVEDMLRIRREGLFNDWQDAVKKGVMSLQSVDSSRLLDPRSAIRDEVQHEIREAAEELNRRVRDSGFLRHALIGGTTFGIACAAGSLGAISANPLAAGAVRQHWSIG